jgi:hypothetical protein
MGLQRQTQAIRRESTPGNKNNVTNLHAYQIRELELYVQLSVKVLHHRHSLSISNIESSISGALPSQSLDKTQSIGVVRTIWGRDLDALKEILETQALAVRKPARSQSVWLPTSSKTVEAERDEVSRLVHSTRRNVDIY